MKKKQPDINYIFTFYSFVFSLLFEFKDSRHSKICANTVRVDSVVGELASWLI